MSIVIKDYVRARRDRALGSIMGYAEREIFTYLAPDERADFRDCVIDALNAYHDSVLDLLKSDDSVRNDELITLLQRVDNHLRVSDG